MFPLDPPDILNIQILISAETASLKDESWWLILKLISVLVLPCWYFKVDAERG